ncbi:hypothetical protein HDU98_002962 [Podochytrium sp. JEL0797]|nr:hypothetical protein HDU98_002962 [Podochytrium sp. JEL0797]
MDFMKEAEQLIDSEMGQKAVSYLDSQSGGQTVDKVLGSVMGEKGAMASNAAKGYIHSHNHQGQQQPHQQQGQQGLGQFQQQGQQQQGQGQQQQGQGGMVNELEQLAMGFMKK